MVSFWWIFNVFRLDGFIKEASVDGEEGLVRVWGFVMLIVRV